MEALVQPVRDVAPLVHLAALEGRRPPEGPPDRLRERLGAVDDVEPRPFGIETALDQVVDMACTVAAFSVAPSARPSTCFAPPVSMPIAATIR